jgi:transcription initiation factor TFIID subunit 6
LPNLKSYDVHLQAGLKDESKREQAEHVVQAIMRALDLLEQDAVGMAHANGHPEGDALKERLVEAVGEVIGAKVFESGRQTLVNAVLETDLAV